MKNYPKLNVTVIESKDIGILGAGEGSTPYLPAFLKTLDIGVEDLVKNRDNQLWFEELMFHYIQPTSIIPQNILAFKKVEMASNKVLRKFKRKGDIYKKKK